jgi:hypothetical protein
VFIQTTLLAEPYEGSSDRISLALLLKIKMYTEDHLEVLKHGPLLVRQLKFCELSVIRRREEMINSLIDRCKWLYIIIGVHIPGAFRNTDES